MLRCESNIPRLCYDNCMRVPYDDLHAQFKTVLIREGFSADRAAEAATIFADASRDGVASHGLNRFPRFVAMVQKGVVDPTAEAEQVSALGGFERWTGKRGPGMLNARQAMARAIELSALYGIACVALADTNHWMRGGAYGWQAAEAGCIGLCWTNTMPNLPPWGGERPLLGNNPFIIAVPRPSGPIVLDMAMSQFSFGALRGYAARGEELPVPGGYDSQGRLTRDAAEVTASGRPLPIGYWKGSGLAQLLDLTAALLSGGLATAEIPADPERESGISQIFIAVGGEGVLGEAEFRRAEEMVSAFEAEDSEGKLRYPGQGSLRCRAESLKSGVKVDPDIWESVRQL